MFSSKVKDETESRESRNGGITDNGQLVEQNYGSDGEDRKAYVVKYKRNTPFPFEVSETVWIVKPEFRAPLGEFRITKAHEDDRFELVKCSDNTTYPELVEGKHLRREV